MRQSYKHDLKCDLVQNFEEILNLAMILDYPLKLDHKRQNTDKILAVTEFDVIQI